MHGLENVDVPGLVILASGAGTIGAMLLLTIGWRRRDRQAIERLRAARHEIEAPASDTAIDVCVEPEEFSETRDLDKNAWKNGLLEPNMDDEITCEYILTSADKDLCARGPAVRPVRVRKHSVA